LHFRYISAKTQSKTCSLLVLSSTRQPTFDLEEDSGPPAPHMATPLCFDLTLRRRMYTPSVRRHSEKIKRYSQ